MPGRAAAGKVREVVGIAGGAAELQALRLERQDLALGRDLRALPAEAQAIVARELNKSALEERADIARLNGSVADDLKSRGLIFVEVDKPAFRQALKTAGFYADWKKKYGDEAWGILEAETGTLS